MRVRGQQTCTTMGKRAISLALAAFFLADNNSIGSKCWHNHVVVAAESESAVSAFDINTKNHEASLLLLNNETDIVDEQRDLAGETYKQLMTTYRKGGASNGHMFNLKAQNGKSIILRGLAINTYKVGALKIEIYVKRGNYKGYEMNRNAWTLWASTTVVGRGSGNPTRIPPSKFPRMAISPNEMRAFYIKCGNAHGACLLSTREVSR